MSCLALLTYGVCARVRKKEEEKKSQPMSCVNVYAGLNQLVVMTVQKSASLRFAGVFKKKLVAYTGNSSTENRQ